MPTEQPSSQTVFANWYPVTESELYKFMAVIIQIGIDNVKSIRLCWASGDSPSYKPWYHRMFARPRFEAIYHSMLHCSESAAASLKEKIEPFMEMLLLNYRSAFYPFQELALEEMVVGFQGRWIYKMFNPSKQKKYHIKVFGLCDSATGYVLNLLTYFGENTSYQPDADPDGGQAVKVFDTLLQPFSKGHHVFADNYLSAKGFYFTGTLNTNRRGFPPQIRTESIANLERKWFFTSHEGVDILCVMWRDKKARKPVVACSTSSSTKIVTQVTRRKTTEKPEIIHRYNQNMNGCDRADQQTGYYGVFNRKTIKWWKKLFYFMFEITQTNAHILYTLSHPNQNRLSLLQFKQTLVDKLTRLSILTKTEARQPGRPATSLIERFTGNKHLIRHSPNHTNCEYCGKGSGSRKRTNFFCIRCSSHPHLHPKNCFEQFHLEANIEL